MKSSVIAHLIETGERDKLKSLLRSRLVESGWIDEMKGECKKIIEERGVDHITVEELAQEVTAKGREKVNSQVKRELLQNIRCVLNN